MSRVVASRVIDAPVSAVWEVFADLSMRASSLSDVEDVRLLTPGPLAVNTRWHETRTRGSGARVTEELLITSVDPGRCCTIALAGGYDENQLTYLFAPIVVGAHRGGTTVTAVAERRPHGLANRLLGFLIGGFAARTAEGALRDELAALAMRCCARIDSVMTTARSSSSPAGAPAARGVRVGEGEAARGVRVGEGEAARGVRVGEGEAA